MKNVEISMVKSFRDFKNMKYVITQSLLLKTEYSRYLKVSSDLVY
eukprot:UN15670